MDNPGSFLARWMRQAQRMFHVVVGLAFLVLSLAGASVSIKLWSDYRDSPEQGLISFELVAAFTVFLLILCLYSFVKARSIR